MTDATYSKKKLKVLYLITGLRLGGAERQLLLLASQIQAVGHKVLVVAMESGGIMAESFRNKNLEVQELDIKGAKTLFSGYLKFSTIVNNFSPDVIHAHMIHANLFSRLLKLFNPQYKLLNTSHNIKEGSKLLMKGYSLTKHFANWTTNVSREALDHYMKQGYFNDKRSSYIPNAIDTQEFYPNEVTGEELRKKLGVRPDTYTFLTAGRLHEQKDHQLLLTSFKIVLEQFPSALLVIAGEGPLDSALKELSNKLGIAGQTLFLGKREDIPSLLNMCNCFVLSSRYEGFGMVVAEALATMKPVISTDCGGVREVMSKYGTLVNVGNKNDLAAKMINEVKCPSEKGNLLKGREHIESNYAINHVITQWLHLYYNITLS
jgi:glycosyltransferase involved in cell wall biosynthesis